MRASRGNVTAEARARTALRFLRLGPCVILAALGAAAGSPAFAGADAPGGSPPAKYVQISPIFSQIVAFSVPAGFVEADQHMNSRFYIRESVLKGETVNHWTQMITVTGQKGAAATRGLTPGKELNLLASGFMHACPTTFNTMHLGTLKVGKYDAEARVLSCGINPRLRTPRSESALIVAIRGRRDVYTIQWALRGAPSKVKLTLRRAEWEGLLGRLQPIRLCRTIRGEKPPFPSCLGGARSTFKSVSRAPIGAGAGACATPGSARCPRVIHGMLNPRIVRSLRVGLATAAQVKRALGTPAYVNHNPDGRFLFLYKPGADIYALVFTPKGVLARIVVFGKKRRASPKSP